MITRGDMEGLNPQSFLYKDENDEEKVSKNIHKMCSWISGGQDLSCIESKGFLVPLLALLFCDNLVVVEQIAKLFKILTLKETLNESLRSLDAIHKLDHVIETSYDALVLADVSTATETLRKCAPNSVRKVGLGNYDSKKGQFEWMLSFKQLDFNSVGVAWKVWDAGIGFSRWIIENRAIFAGKKILEVGAGLGISGLTAALFAEHVLLTDYTPTLLATLAENVKLNSTKYPEFKKSTKIMSLDWLSEQVPEPNTYDIVIGTEVVYDEKLVAPLANIIYNALPLNGIFYGVSASVRQGIPQFKECMHGIGFKVEVNSFPTHLLPDSKLEYGSNDCLFFVCTKLI
eukprot:Phypoly_transcript_07584.p1 GENE.Phypoly_transcript_07584~~Phypoly_transcript_07584.p1  ORF type:complete len:344 (+),score=41.14 Phypoly_transcript_07584:586-1617(+)